MQMPENAALLLEGGALRGVYTSGVLDAYMEQGIYFPCVAGVSAGGINGVNYVSRQPGRSARINLCYRHDPRYLGALPLLRSHGLFGLDFILDDLKTREPFDQKTFEENPAKLYVVATNVDTGAPAFFEKSACPDFRHAVAASASMPLCSLPVKVEGRGRYLDGGCSCAIPLDWALEQGYDKIVVVSTRQKGFRKTLPGRRMVELYYDFYHRSPAFLNALLTMERRYNQLMDRMDALEAQGRIFVQRPQTPVEVGRLEGDTERLLAFINQGHSEALAALPALQEYLAK